MNKKKKKKIGNVKIVGRMVVVFVGVIPLLRLSEKG